MSTTNLNIDYLVDSQSQKTVTVNEALDALDGVLGNLLAKTITDANYTLSATEALDNLVYVISGTLTANRNIIVPNNKKLYIVRNATTGSHSLVIKTSAGTGQTLAVSATTYALLYCDGTNVVAVGATGSAGTVTSVAVSVPSFLTVSGSPITSSGTVAISATTGLTANSVLATPDGVSGAVSIRLLVAADIPNLAASKITTGALALARGGTGVDLSATGAATFVLAQDAAHVISARALIAADIPNIAASLITSGTLALARGGTNADLSASGGSTFVLAQDASHVVSARALIAADIPSLAASIIASGTLALARGGTNADLSASGSATAVLAQDGSHVVSARSLIAADIPSLAASILTSGQVALARGGTGADLSASGSATAVLAQDGSHVISARALIAADIPSLDAAKITTGVFDSSKMALGINDQTGTTYTVLDGDRGKLVNLSNTSSIAVTLPQAGASSQFASGWFAWLKCDNNGVVTITPATSTIGGLAKLVLTRGQVALILSDGTNYRIVDMTAAMRSFIGPGILSAYGLASGTAAMFNVANQIRAMKFTLPGVCVINKLALNIATAAAGCNVAIAIYSADGSALLLDSGAISAVATGVKTVTLGAAVILQPGEYWLCCVTDTVSPTPVITQLPLPTGPISFINSNSHKNVATGNAYAAGWPSSLGTLTTDVTTGAPAVLFET